MIAALMFGGAFNPPTKAHIQLADLARKASGVEKVVFVPTKQSYIRDDQGKDYAFTNEERLDMLRRIASGKDWMLVSDYEINASAQPRTYQTLCHLRDEEGIQCRLLFGSDKLPELETVWRHIDDIAAEFGFVVMTREEDDCERMIREDPFLSQLEEAFLMVDTPLTFRQYSSSKVRTLLRERDESGDDPELVRMLELLLPGELHFLFKR